ncbi:hypothetical protein [Agromyces archimandritae]|uniref:Uncharacterized protein n=1 Tax=Agromyces archimandritae TaxID=2781962 RepID=A0A975FLK2_9MICO|nr:hypothetical protein [Agromyces archimandritae]QTX03688.1 hypothetical protein G127AT_10110 [Agromyces archimandritae]
MPSWGWALLAAGVLGASAASLFGALGGITAGVVARGETPEGLLVWQWALEESAREGVQDAAPYRDPDIFVPEEPVEPGAFPKRLPLEEDFPGLSADWHRPPTIAGWVEVDPGDDVPGFQLEHESCLLYAETVTFDPAPISDAADTESYLDMLLADFEDLVSHGTAVVRVPAATPDGSSEIEFSEDLVRYRLDGVEHLMLVRARSMPDAGVAPVLTIDCYADAVDSGSVVPQAVIRQITLDVD